MASMTLEETRVFIKAAYAKMQTPEALASQKASSAYHLIQEHKAERDRRTDNGPYPVDHSATHNPSGSYAFSKSRNQ